MRLRLPELLEAKGLTAYALAKQSGGRLTRSLCYRLVADRGVFRCLAPDQLDALCEVLEVTPDQLFAPRGRRRR